MNNRTFHVSFEELKLEVSQIETILGYNEGDDRELVTGLIQEIFEESKDLGNIKAEYRVFENVYFNNADKSLNFNGVSFFLDKIVYSQIKKAEHVAFFICTAGNEIGERRRKCMNERDFLKGYVYDVIGSEIVEAAADILQSQLEKDAGAEGWKITNRYSPGYCGWNVSEQHKLFSIFKDNFCGIRLTPSALMEPVKSASGVIGIGAEVKMKDYICNLCNMKDCIYRRARKITA